MTELVRVIFDAVKGHETDKGVCYFTSNDRAQKQTIIRRKQIVQEFEIGSTDKTAVAKSAIARLRKNIRYYHNVNQYYSLNPQLNVDPQKYMDLADKAEEEIKRLEKVVFDSDAQKQAIDDEWFEYGIVFDAQPDILHRGPMSRQDAVDWIKEWEDDGGKVDTFYIVRRPIGEWEKYNG